MPDGTLPGTLQAIRDTYLMVGSLLPLLEAKAGSERFDISLRAAGGLSVEQAFGTRARDGAGIKRERPYGDERSTDEPPAWEQL